MRVSLRVCWRGEHLPAVCSQIPRHQQTQRNYHGTSQKQSPELVNFDSICTICVNSGERLPNHRTKRLQRDCSR